MAANAYATVDEFLAATGAMSPGFLTLGPHSTGTVEEVAPVTDGDVITLETVSRVFPTVTETYTAVAAAPAAFQFVSTDLSTFVDAVNADSTLATAVWGDPIALLTSVTTGADSMHLLSSDAAQPAELILSGPNLAGGDSVLQIYLDCAAEMIDPACWGDKTNCGHIYLTGHMLDGALGAERGPLTDQKIGDISASYADPPTLVGSGPFGSTHWGRLYEAVKSTLLVFAAVGRRTTVTLF
jgi:hypothetical protein